MSRIVCSDFDISTVESTLPPQVSENGRIAYIDLNAELPATEEAERDRAAVWHPRAGRIPHASDLAYITLQAPVRVAVHASVMLQGIGGDQ